jgi:hypothetical protein
VTNINRLLSIKKSENVVKLFTKEIQYLDEEDLIESRDSGQLKITDRDSELSSHSSSGFEG